jgi:hypothetical protein
MCELAHVCLQIPISTACLSFLLPADEDATGMANAKGLAIRPFTGKTGRSENHLLQCLSRELQIEEWPKCRWRQNFLFCRRVFSRRNENIDDTRQFGRHRLHAVRARDTIRVPAWPPRIILTP